MLDALNLSLMDVCVSTGSLDVVSHIQVALSTSSSDIPIASLHFPLTYPTSGEAGSLRFLVDPLTSGGWAR